VFKTIRPFLPALPIRASGLFHVKLFHNFLDLIYPPRCPVCGAFLCDEETSHEEESSFCRACCRSFLPVGSPFCPICGRPFKAGNPVDHVCEDCLRRRPFFKEARAPYIYEGSLMTAIHEFKYGAKSFLAKPLGLLLSSFAKTWLEANEGLLLMPVPLHPRRLRERGFNQSLLLAREVAKALNADLDFLSLKRIKYTKPQTGLGSEERSRNVRRAFQVLRREAVKGRRIVLVDDVATTGSTLNECARALKKAGCREVFCLTLARTSTF
jgi:ComF family protein